MNRGLIRVLSIVLGASLFSFGIIFATHSCERDRVTKLREGENALKSESPYQVGDEIYIKPDSTKVTIRNMNAYVIEQKVWYNILYSNGNSTDITKDLIISKVNHE